MFKPVEVKALPDYKLHLRFADGTEGEVDLSDLAGRGVFRLWDDVRAFEGVYISSHGTIAWSDDVELCPDALYLRLTGMQAADVFSNLRDVNVDA